MGEEIRVVADEAQEVEALLLARAFFYELMHKAFGGYASTGLIETLVGPATREVVDTYAQDSVELRGFAGFLGKLAGMDAAELADQAEGEYTRLFVGPGRPEAFPYESPYITGKDTYFQANTVATRGEYHARGLKAAREGHNPDDHVALELALMAHLGMGSLAALRGGDAAGLASGLRDQAAFAGAHLAWLDKFAVAARHGKTAILYPQLAEALAAFVRLDTVFLAETAFWAEGLAGEGATLPAIERSEALAAVEDALNALRGIQLKGLAENELVEA